MDLSVSIPQTGKRKMKPKKYSWMDDEYDDEPVSLEECMKAFTQPVRLDRPCLSCGSEDCIDKQMTLFRYPKVLVVHMKRFEEEQDFTFL